jgi:hypothetical protein
MNVNSSSTLITLGADDGRVLLSINRDGTVDGSLADAGEAAAKFVEFVRQGMAPLLTLNAPTEPASDWYEYCEHCPDDHASPLSRPWAVWVGPYRDADGQPTHLLAAPTGGQHVAETDAGWLREVIRSERRSSNIPFVMPPEPELVIDELSDRVCAALTEADVSLMGLERDECLGVPDPYDKDDGYSSSDVVTIRNIVASTIAAANLFPNRKE